MEDARWLDSELGTNYSADVERRLARSGNEYHIDDNAHFDRLVELLYILGLDGMNNTFVNAGLTGGQPSYSLASGDPNLPPIGVRFFPVNENFKTLRLYADTDNRRLTHQQGRYHEAVISYDPNKDMNNDSPLTSIFNFITDSVYDDSHPLPDFLGFRINFQGLNEPAEFFCPNYDWEPQPNETDYRRTVYWNPQMTTDPEGRAHLEFFNNGFSERLAVSAEGITANGQPITTRP